MSNIGISVEPGQLVFGAVLLAILLPAVWFLSYRSLAGLGSVRRVLAIALRSSLIVLIVAALCEVKLERRSDKLTVIYLLDLSESIPEPKREAMLDYVYQEVNTHRRRNRLDRAGVIIFGANAKIEVPPFDDDILINRIESNYDLRTDATSMEAALKLAKASFPEDSAKRVVIVTDGNENLGDAAALARSLADDGVGIDCVPVKLEARSEVQVEKVSIPSDIRKDQAFQTLVIINNESLPTPNNPEGLVSGTLKLTQTTRQTEQLVNEVPVLLTPGKNVIPFRHEISRSAMFTYRATFYPDDPSQDTRLENNQASTFTHVRGRGKVLLIEDWKHAGEFDYFVDRLRSASIEVDVIPSNSLFTRKEELLEYDSVVLANVPRSSGDSALEASSFSDEQIQMLVNNTESMGCGLVMIGGPNSFGAGGWTNTELEKAMPVDFQITNKEVQAVGALVLLMHASEMKDGNHWQKVIGREAIETLGPLDYCGLLEWADFRGVEEWAWQPALLQVQGNKRKMLSTISGMTPGDMPYFEPAMQMALQELKNVDAAVKHMIIISDGDPIKASPVTIQGFVDNGIKISTVAIGSHGPPGSTPLREMADATEGNYYVVTKPDQLPRIYQREARRVSRPLLFESQQGINAIGRDINAVTGITQGIDVDSIPPVTGYVLTTLKNSSLVEQILIADKPGDNTENSTLLATWRYGLGRATIYTSDAGARWGASWLNTELYDKFFTQMVRNSMRPITEDAEFLLASEVKNGKVHVVVTALDADKEFVNFLNVKASVNRPDLTDFSLDLKQVAPGRYEGEFDADLAGSYTFMVDPGDGYTRPRGGVNVPFSSEFNDRETNEALLETLVSYAPVNSETGLLITGDLGGENLDELLEVDTFRHNLPRAISFRDLWLILLFIAACMFFADVFIRRVAISFEWIPVLFVALKGKILGTPEVVTHEGRMARLQSQKQAVAKELDQRRASMRFEPKEKSSGDEQATFEQVVRDVSGGAESKPKKTPKRSEQITPSEDDRQSYTSRLLEAKKKAQKDRKQN